MNKQYTMLTRTALLLSLTLLFQSLRFIIPIPAFLSTFLIGSLVNACLLIATETIGVRSAFIIGFLAPIIAYMQQLLPLPILILPVALGNAIYIAVFFVGRNYPYLRVGSAAVSKSIFMYFSFSWLFSFIAIPAKVAASILFIMSWPQVITGLVGGILTILITRRLSLHL